MWEKHDFELFKENFTGCLKGILFLADKGYQGILELHLNSKTPIKRSKNQKLSKEEKSCNRDLSKQRIFIRPPRILFSVFIVKHTTD